MLWLIELNQYRLDLKINLKFSNEEIQKINGSNKKHFTFFLLKQTPFTTGSLIVITLPFEKTR